MVWKLSRKQKLRIKLKGSEKYTGAEIGNHPKGTLIQIASSEIYFSKLQVLKFIFPNCKF